MQQDPVQRISAPAIGLLIAGIVSGIGSIVWILLMLGAGTLALVDSGAQDALFGVGVWLVVAFVRLALDGAAIYGALQLRQLKNWNLSLAGAIAACIPCSFCCFLTVPLGIWAAVVLLNDEIKQSFVGSGPAAA